MMAADGQTLYVSNNVSGTVTKGADTGLLSRAHGGQGRRAISACRKIVVGPRQHSPRFLMQAVRKHCGVSRHTRCLITQVQQVTQLNRFLQCLLELCRAHCSTVSVS